MEEVILSKPIDFSSLYLISSNINIHSAGVALFESIDGLNLEADFHYAMSFSLILCHAGFARIRINDRCYRLHPYNMLVIVPKSIFQLVELSSDFRFQCISLADKFLAEMIYDESRFEKLINNLRKNASIPLDESKKQSLQYSYALIKSIFKHGELYPFLKEILESHVTAIFWKIHGYSSRNLQKPQGPLSKNEQLFQNFIQQVVKFHPYQHNTSYYAEQLGVSVKYLSSTIKIFSSKSAKEWIDSYLIISAKKLLANPEKSIQQVANELNFPDQGFFCKFFKRYTKVSPKDFRYLLYPPPPTIDSTYEITC